jgi:hypothetical protein
MAGLFEQSQSVAGDEEYTSALRIDVKGSWGVILLPRDVESQTRLWRKMSSGVSHFVRQTKQLISSNMPNATGLPLKAFLDCGLDCEILRPSLSDLAGRFGVRNWPKSRFAI